MKNLKYVLLSNSLEYLGDHSFSGCSNCMMKLPTSLKEVDMFLITDGKTVEVEKGLTAENCKNLDTLISLNEQSEGKTNLIIDQ